MGSNYQFLLISLLLFSCYALGGGYGWIPIVNLSDTKVVDIGKFAVARHKYQAKTQLAFFNNLVNGQTRSRAGTEYNITIAAKDGNNADMLKNYVAVVIDKQFQEFMHLVSFRGPV